MSILLDNLNDGQKEVVTAQGGPVLVVAGAGTGKTTVLTRRIAYLVEQGLAQESEILALTFTDKATSEIEERVSQHLGHFTTVTISTFHGFAEKVLRQSGVDIGLSTDFKLLNDTGQWILFKENLEKFELDYYRPAGRPTKFIKDVLSHFSRVKEEGVTPEKYLKYVETLPKGAAELELEIVRQRELATVYGQYQQLMLNEACLDFADLIYYTVQLWQQRPNVLRNYQKKYKYILVDEFQDTNWGQYQLIKLISLPENNLMVVGDDQQSIYKFRGASLSNILSFGQDFKEMKVISLVDNYRSVQPILDLAYRFIVHNNPDRLEYQLNHRDQHYPTESLADFKISQQLKSKIKGSGSGLQAWQAQNEFQEMKAVLTEIKRLHQSGVSLAEIAILVRSNLTAKLWAAELEQNQIPYLYAASTGLYQSGVVKDLIAYLRLLVNPYLDDCFYRVLGAGNWQIPVADIQKITYWAKRQQFPLFVVSQKILAGQLAQDISLSEGGALQLGQLLLSLTKYSEDVNKINLSEIIYQILEETNYLGFLSKLSLIKSQTSFNQLQAWLQKLEEYQNDFGLGIKGYLDYYAQEIEAGDQGSLAETDSDSEAVQLLTVHKSKGLEFDYVFLVNLVDRKFPTVARQPTIPLPGALINEVLPEASVVAGEAHLQEERRLFYVAVTRAKQGLYLTTAQDYGGARLKKPSRFIAEAGLELVPLTNLNLNAKTSPAVQDKGSQSKDTSAGAWYSYSQFKDFSSCPLRYKYKYILKVPERGSHYLVFGQVVHQVLEDSFKLIKDRQALGLPANKWITLAEMVAKYNKLWRDDWFQSAEQRVEYKKRGLQMLTDFFSKYNSQWPDVRELEAKFKLVRGADNIVGKIDRIDNIPGGVRLVDYKTGKPQTIKTVDKKQLMLYQLVALDQGLVPLELVFYYLEDGSEVSFLGTEKDLSKTEAYITQQRESIASSDFPPKASKFNCQGCAFSNICDSSLG